MVKSSLEAAVAWGGTAADVALYISRQPSSATAIGAYRRGPMQSSCATAVGCRGPTSCPGGQPIVGKFQNGRINLQFRIKNIKKIRIKCYSPLSIIAISESPRIAMKQHVRYSQIFLFLFF
jgi:hypothetical protein